jgi:hypothetical protein
VGISVDLTVHGRRLRAGFGRDSKIAGLSQVRPRTGNKRFDETAPEVEGFEILRITPTIHASRLMGFGPSDGPRVLHGVGVEGCSGGFAVERLKAN